ncbi:MAG: hypothetical protein EA379_06345 [Phycisphaerales bacterium]|nr:MAG: hypothetical protein EA379_06345 [Phycisphaerales bacterium]
MRKRSAILWTCAAGLLLGAGWYLLRAQTGESADRRPAMERAKAQRETFANVEMRPIDRASVGEVRSLVEDSFALPHHDFGGVDETARVALVHLLASHLAAYASDDPTALARLAEREATRWITDEDAREWMIIDNIANRVWGRPGDRADPRAELIRFRESTIEGGGRAVALGDGEEGVLVRVRRVRRPEEMYMRPLTAEESSRWVPGRTAAAVRFRLPVVSFEDVLRRDRSVTVAEVFFNVGAEEGSFVWHTVWYYDPRSAVWNLHVSSSAGWLTLVALQH